MEAGQWKAVAPIIRQPYNYDPLGSDLIPITWSCGPLDSHMC